MIKRHPLVAYFALAYGASAIVFAVLRVAPDLSFVAFPPLVAAVAATSIGLTAAIGGRPALADLWARIRRWRIDPRWYLVLLVPPAGILLTLFALKTFESPVFAPGLQWFGTPIGLVAGLLEEIGWTGFAYPRLRLRLGAAAGAVLLGLMWGLWHFPVVDSLGAASPHGAAWPAFFASFVGLVAAYRCLICWAYDRTQSVLLAQLMHAAFTGFLVTFSAAHVNPWQEAQWYAVYAGLLWLVIAVGAAVRFRAGERQAVAG